MVLGGDGFMGWPITLRLSAAGHEVLSVDNFSRRAIEAELGAESLTPICDLGDRLSAWLDVTDKPIGVEVLDVCEYRPLLNVLKRWRPDAVIHLAELRSAPYSMRSANHKCRTVDNNLLGTHNLLAALVEAQLDAHVVHIGTMGVYGYESGRYLEEGYARVLFSPPASVPEAVRQQALDWNDAVDILHPCAPGSVYHLTKAMEELMFQFYARNDQLRITDLHQGIVWGTQTLETSLDIRLINRFDYDSDYGTVLNRFLMQAAIGCPLTVYGNGGQARAFIHIEDSMRCILLAIENPPARGERPLILNQMTEVHKVADLARMVHLMTGAAIARMPNPRLEAEENRLNVQNKRLRSMGLDPTYLDDGLLREIIEVATKYAGRCDRTKIAPQVYWTEELRRRARA